ncbi:small kinetochore-associated protein [Aythya fuligula]|uniref:Small kinetochore-associated protein n=1 Tax=Aythya fuligula TaxID=219594 RepID=A0A6J3D3M3_AYTFU|nr:small kinetochore-associated protein [Aythya fuligula]
MTLEFYMFFLYQKQTEKQGRALPRCHARGASAHARHRPTVGRPLRFKRPLRERAARVGAERNRSRFGAEPEPKRSPTETQMAFSSKKQCVGKTLDPEFNEDPNFNFTSSIPADGVFKATNQGIPKSAKKAEPLLKKTATRGPLSRHKLEAELKAKNQLLETAKQQLHTRLTGAQSTIKELKEKNEGLVQEVEKLKKFQETCMVILESRNIDPVTGSNIVEEEEKTRECQKQTTLLTEKLLAELRVFNEAAEKEKEALQMATAKWKLAEETRQQSLEKHSSFQAEMQECSAILTELEKLLAA